MVVSFRYVLFVYGILSWVTAYGRQANLFTSKNETYSVTTTASNKTDKECRVIVNGTGLSFLQELGRSKVIHAVELDLQFAFKNDATIKKRRWLWIDRVGQEIMAVLSLKSSYMHVIPCTLNAGRETVQLHVSDDPSGCTTTERSPEDFIAGALLRRLSINHRKEICYDEVSGRPAQRKCCKIFGNDLSKYRCHVRSTKSDYIHSIKSVVFAYAYGLCVSCGVLTSYFGIILLWQKSNRTDGYQKLTDSPMSVLSILFMLFWDGYGKVRSFVRRVLLVVLLFFYFWSLNCFDSAVFSTFFSLWVFFPFSNIHNAQEISVENHSPAKRVPYYLLKAFRYLGYDIDVYLSEKESVSAAIGLITLPLNITRWKKSLAGFYERVIASRTSECSLRHKILLCGKAVVFYPGYIFLISVLQVLLISVFVVYFLILLWDNMFNNKRKKCFYILSYLSVFSTLLLFTFFLFWLPGVAISLLSGIILNIVYFFPYIVYTSILTFYAWMFWSSVEQQYVVLMRLIYDCNLDNESNNNVTNCNGSDNSIGNLNNHNSNNDEHSNVSGNSDIYEEDIPLLNMADNDLEDEECEMLNENCAFLCVVSKELYDNVRERLLPYHVTLFFFALKVVLIFLFSYLTLTLVRVLQASDVSPTVQLLTTVSVSAFPYIMNIVGAKKGEDQKDAWKEQLKQRVKPLVDKLTAGKPELRRTQYYLSN